MKAILEFDLSDPDDNLEFQTCTIAGKMQAILFDIYHNMNKQIEWKVVEIVNNSDTKGDVFYKTLDAVIDYIHEKADEMNLNINEL